jgi:hypothetical protein
VYEGELHYDVDTPEDLVNLKKELAANPKAALHTAEFLRSSKRNRGVDLDVRAPQITG